MREGCIEDDALEDLVRVMGPHIERKKHVRPAFLCMSVLAYKSFHHGNDSSYHLTSTSNPQCRAVAHEFLGCIESNKRDYSACKDLSKAYLQCRMEKVCQRGRQGSGAGGRVYV